MGVGEMTLQEAISAAIASGGELWFRPVGMRGNAFTLDGNHTEFVPGRRGGMRGMTSDARWLLGEWETLTPKLFYQLREME